MKDNSSVKFIFDKYAKEYQGKYVNVDIYSGTLDLLLELMEKDGSRVLDVGCGPGNISRYLLNKAPLLNILGIDISENMISLARENNPEAQFRIIDCRELRMLESKFDTVVSGFLAPYLDPDALSDFIKDAYEVLDPGGVIYLSTMDAEKADQGFQVSTSSTKETLLTYYHGKSFLRTLLTNNHFEIESIHYLNNPNNVDGIKDLIFIARKP
ncbi:methyltransferase domain-containing protein [Gramella sp. MT6]|uniref:class I SAM-dependent DNA methyltransferase n=1 Tax=Gramella sp. MT6 TaxID=2705471 RepID=UPI001C6020A3|nr:class I SAM-dependent methyltransferase [Gramella sp. MT6]QYA24492.1 methyltransferase domain-containing protein [Gramella sp. MT6]